MIDIHCHVMPGIDDGSKNLEESLVMLENATTSGITDMILTPHYIDATKYRYDNRAKEQILAIIKEAARRANIDINLYYGNEVYIDRKLPELIASGRVATLAGSRYLLLELPIAAEDRSAGDIIFKLRSNGIVPIIAHPERYNYFQRRPESVMKYIELGCILQGDYLSLLGKYGRKAQKTLKTLLKQGKIAMLASDIHHGSDDPRLPEAYKKVHQVIKDMDKVQELFIDNPEKVLKNERIK